MGSAAGLDVARVGAYLAGALKGFCGPVSARKFANGQSNPTYLLHAASGDYVLRRKPPGKLLRSAHAVEREFRVQSALAGGAVPVAWMLHLCEDPEVIGTAFYVMEYLDGRNFTDPRLQKLARAQRGAIFDEMCRVLAALHGVDIAAVGLADYGPPGNYYARQLARWTKQYRAAQTEPIANMEALIAALAERMPADDGQRCLVHGDYRLDNLIFAPDSPACIAVLDWELSTIGHPFADLAGLIMQWRMPVGRDGRGLAGVDRAALGLPEDAAFIDAYCARRGLAEVPDFGFYLGFCFFRMGAILQGVKARALKGNASDPEHGLAMGRLVPQFAAHGLEALADG